MLSSHDGRGFDFFCRIADTNITKKWIECSIWWDFISDTVINHTLDEIQIYSEFFSICGFWPAISCIFILVQVEAINKNQLIA
jgi:hypothetical protein